MGVVTQFYNSAALCLVVSRGQVDDLISRRVFQHTNGVQTRSQHVRSAGYARSAYIRTIGRSRLSLLDSLDREARERERNNELGPGAWAMPSVAVKRTNRRFGGVGPAL